MNYSKKIFLPIILVSILIISGCTSLIKKNPATNPDGGVFKSTDFGENWKQKNLISKTGETASSLNNTNIKFLIFDPETPGIIYLSTEGKGIYKSLDGGEQWTPTKLNSGSYVSLGIDNRNTKVLYLTNGTKIIKSIDGGNDWMDIYVENRPKQKILSVIVDQFSQNIIYAATSSSVLRSINYGNSWELLSWNGTDVSDLNQSIKNGKTLYLLTKKSIFKTIDGGENFTNITQNLSQYKDANTIYWLNFDPRTEFMYIGTGYGILRSLTGGDTWEPVPTLFDFKKIPIKKVIHKPSDIENILFSVDNILHKTTDGAKTWQSLKSIPTSRLINYLALDPFNNDNVFAGTLLVKK